MRSIRSSSRHPAHRLAALVLTAACAPAALADFPVVYDQGFPNFHGAGSARKLVNGSETFANGFNGFPMDGSWSTDTSFSSSLSGSANTGGGIGGPPPALALTSGSFGSNFAESSVLTITGGGSAFWSLFENAGPNEFLIAAGGGDFSFSFSVTAPIIAQWSASGTTLKRNGVVLPVGGAAVWNLDPGVYIIEGSFGGYRSNLEGVVTSGGTSSAGFSFQIGIPAPASCALFAAFGLVAGRRRR